MMNYPITVLVCVTLMAVAAAGGRALRRQDRDRPLRLMIGVGALVVWVLSNGWYLSPAQFEADVSLPLHICDLAALMAPLALLTRKRWLQTMTYFWAFALTTQGFATPTIDVGPGDVRYWLFWTNHGIVVGIAVYLVVVERYRPTKRDLLAALGLTTIWFVTMVLFDIVTGWNYGYVGQTPPETRSLIDVLGPWPLRLLWIAIIAALSFVLVWLPWPVWAWVRRTGDDASVEVGTATIGSVDVDVRTTNDDQI